MSKTAQRKRTAYQAGYTVGRHGWPDGVKSYRVKRVADPDWHRGRRDGIRDRVAAQRLERSWTRRLVAWLRILGGRP